MVKQQLDKMLSVVVIRLNLLIIKLMIALKVEKIVKATMVMEMAIRRIIYQAVQSQVLSLLALLSSSAVFSSLSSFQRENKKKDEIMIITTTMQAMIWNPINLFGFQILHKKAY